MFANQHFYQLTLRFERFLLTLMLSFAFLHFSCNKKTLPQPGNKITFQKSDQPVWEGTLVAGDPCVIKDGSGYKMYYTSVETTDSSENILISVAKSANGLNWQHIAGSVESIALQNNRDSWDKYLEAVDVIKDENDIKMYYCGYPAEATEINTTVANGEIGVANSTDGLRFTRKRAVPVLKRGAQNAMDNNALFSPAVIKDKGSYTMLYTGWCIDSCNKPFIGILSAQSIDGVTWSKNPGYVIAGTDSKLDWIKLLIEVDLVKGPDNIFYLFFTGEGGLGVARSSSPLGPYEIFPQPILVKQHSWESAKIIAPSVIIEDNKVRMWYMGVVGQFDDFSIGYAETVFPFDW